MISRKYEVKNMATPTYYTYLKFNKNVLWCGSLLTPSLSLFLPPSLSLSSGDVSPIDVISHIPVFYEEKEVPYCYVPSRRQLGTIGYKKTYQCSSY